MRIITLAILMAMSVHFVEACPIEVGGFTKGDAEGLEIGEDSWHIFIKKKKNRMSKRQFNDIINKAVSIYGPIIEKLGGKLKVKKQWWHPRVNAFAHRTGNTWHLTFTGGMARHKDQTPDGFAAVVCHEIGHHIGGYPRYPGDWASNEGQSDYFATAKCFKKLFGSDFNNADLVADLIFDIGNPIERKCADAYPADPQAYYTCMRSIKAAQAISNVLASLSKDKKPEVGTPSSKKVDIHSDAHPRAQCRLDTEVQGAICNKPIEIPYGTSDYSKGYCTRAEGYIEGVRPRCWFSPKQAERESLAAWF